MPASKPNIVTTKYEGQMGDREYVFACKGRPFCVLTAPQFPTPAFTMIDHNLVRELGLRMTDMQCVKMRYGGQNLRILGKISTSVQCIIDGAPVGNMYLKAHVVTDVYQLFNTYAIAGSKLTDKLVGEPKDDEAKADETFDEPTEPTDSAKKKKRKKTKATTMKSPLASPASRSQSTPASTPNTMASLHHALATGAFHINTKCMSPQFGDRSPLPPSPLVQGRWIMKYHRVGSSNPADFEPYWVDRMTGKEQYMEPNSWESNGSMYSYQSGDEYDDVYTNVSTIIKGVTDDDPANKQQDDEVFGRKAKMKYLEGRPDDEVASSPNYTIADQKLVRSIWKEGQDVPRHLQHVPIPHGAKWCDPDCLYLRDLPPDCGYHERWDRVAHCCPECTGGWCGHTRSMPGRDWMS